MPKTILCALAIAFLAFGSCWAASERPGDPSASYDLPIAIRGHTVQRDAAIIAVCRRNGLQAYIEVTDEDDDRLYGTMTLPKEARFETFLRKLKDDGFSSHIDSGILIVKAKSAQKLRFNPLNETYSKLAIAGNFAAFCSGISHFLDERGYAATALPTDRLLTAEVYSEDLPVTPGSTLRDVICRMARVRQVDVVTRVYRLKLEDRSGPHAFLLSLRF